MKYKIDKLKYSTCQLSQSSMKVELCEKWQGVTYIGDRKIVHQFTKKGLDHQVVIAQRLAWRLATGEVPGSNPGKGENLLIFD